MTKEVSDLMKSETFVLIKQSEVPEGVRLLPAVWQMKRKRNIKTCKIKKWEARLNLDGSQMKKGVHYDQTYAPVAK